MTTDLHLEHPTLREAEGRVIETGDGWVRVEPTLFYATGGGQPGDTGTIAWSGCEARVEVCERDARGSILRLADGECPEVGIDVVQRIDWDRRWSHMRVHTALHLLSVVIPLPVTGGAISEGKGRLDFDMPEPPQDKEAIAAALRTLIDTDESVTMEWIDEAELDANPGLVKTLRVQPPRGSGKIRLVRIGAADGTIDLQPCGGTHVGHTSEVGPIRIGKIEKKGGQNRRVYVHLDD
ncbi:alanyl-tRNA editing protein [Palleronia sp. LCG004]|uniref:alanyl-tRNA editing protein n=1 Tax=Palleronia sp. LCG004 TaxID=3079304 RepID=UPI00294351AA|nr:alanyl-tRNA editing protein [Palleronia sp. LCG004]WOI55082.1 alanyl-tRNA editing protein [Palleronia sp. LCG004]